MAGRFYTEKPKSLEPGSILRIGIDLDNGPIRFELGEASSWHKSILMDLHRNRPDR